MFLALIAHEPRLYPLLAATGGFVGAFARRIRSVRRHFSLGLPVAAKVIDPSTGMVAALGDLGTHAGAFYPTIRIFRAPIDRASPEGFSSADDIPCVATLLGAPGGHKWDAFNPVPACCATSDTAEVERLKGLVPEWQWAFLNEALFRIPRPYLPGLYPVPVIED